MVLAPVKGRRKKKRSDLGAEGKEKEGSSPAFVEGPVLRLMIFPTVLNRLKTPTARQITVLGANDADRRKANGQCEHVPELESFNGLYDTSFGALTRPTSSR